MLEFAPRVCQRPAGAAVVRPFEVAEPGNTADCATVAGALAVFGGAAEVSVSCTETADRPFSRLWAETYTFLEFPHENKLHAMAPSDGALSFATTSEVVLTPLVLTEAIVVAVVVVLAGLANDRLRRGLLSLLRG